MKNRSLLMIPGPIEFDPAVLAALGAPTTSHLAPEFIEAFGQALERTRALFHCPDGQPFVLAGTGTLGMDTACANLIEPGDAALVVNTGYFGDRIGAILERYGAQVTQVRAAPGGHPALAAVEQALQGGRFKVMTITQMDTSTGVLADVRGLAALGQRYGALVITSFAGLVGGVVLLMGCDKTTPALLMGAASVDLPTIVLSSGPMLSGRYQGRPIGSGMRAWAPCWNASSRSTGAAGDTCARS